MQKVALIIPCYNEEKRIQKDLVISLLDTTAADVYLANDGSTDKTLKVISNITEGYENRCFILNYKSNKGKATTIYNAVNEVLKRNYTHIGYFDADFATPPKEIARMLTYVQKKPEVFVIGSRVKLLNSKIHRKFYRHIIGRIIVTIVNIKFDLGIYDTQCGAKIFPESIARKAFNKPFLTSWLFDMEVFIRLKNNNLLSLGKELPLHHWKDVDGSKLGWKTAFKILKEIVILYRY